MTHPTSQTSLRPSRSQALQRLCVLIRVLTCIPICVLACVPISGCSALLGGSDEPPVERAAVDVRVLDLRGAPVEGAQVSVGRVSAPADSAGWAHLSEVAVGRYVGQIQKPGFIPGVASIEVVFGRSSYAQVTLVKESAPQILKAELGGTAVAGEYSLVFLPNSVQTQDGRLVAGEFEVRATPYDPHQVRDGLEPAFPLLGMVQQPTSRPEFAPPESAPLESQAMVHVEITQGGAPLQLVPGKPAELHAALDARIADHFTVDDLSAPIPTWSFKPALGLWSQEGSSVVRLGTDGRKEVVAQLAHFSMWNCDIRWPKPENDCTVVKVIDVATGMPLPSARITVVGRDVAYGWTTPAPTGEMCFDLHRGTTVEFGAALPGYRLKAAKISTGSGRAGISCAPAEVAACSHINIEMCKEGSPGCGGCPAGTTECGGRCIDTQRDPKNCGGCGSMFECKPNLTCVAGSCKCVAMGYLECPAGSGACVNPQTNSQHCGGCGIDCGKTLPGSACKAGSCDCAAPLITCGSGASKLCVDPRSDVNHCGGCMPCTAGSECVAGVCQARWTSSLLQPGVNLKALSFAGREDGWTVGDGGAIYRYRALTRDWQLLPLPMGLAQNFRAVWMDNKENVWVGGDAGAVLHYRPAAMGKAPEFVREAPGTTAAITGLSGWRADRVYAVSTASQILVYEGRAWRTLSAVVGGPALYAVEALRSGTSDEVFAVGENNTLLYKPPGVDTFTKRMVMANAMTPTVVLRAVHGASPGLVFAAGDAGLLSVTKDQGMSWQDIPLRDAAGARITAALNGVWAASPMDIFVVSSAGHLFHSRDGGMTFSLERTAGYGLAAIGGPQASQIYAVGANGILLR